MHASTQREVDDALRRLVTFVMVALLALFVSGAALAQEVEWEARGPYVDEIILPIILDQEAQIIALQRGDIHVLPGLAQPSHIERLEADPNVDITVSPGYHMFYLGINMRTPPLSDVVVRRALAHVINRDEIIFSLFQGYMLPLAEFVPRRLLSTIPIRTCPNMIPSWRSRSWTRPATNGSRRRPHRS